jgi:V8-like Glu-specific endopeptidase
MLFQVTDEYFDSIIHRSIGALTFRDCFNRPAIGSATIISKDLILTAAHNIYDKDRNLEYTQFKFYLAPNQTIDTTTDYYDILDWRYMPEFKSSSKGNRLQYDYALMRLKIKIERPIKYL